MKTAGVINGLALAMVLLVFSNSLCQVPHWFNQELVNDPEITDRELTSYVEAALEIQYIQQETQRRMWRAVMDEEFELQTYHQLSQAAREDRIGELEYKSDEELMRYNRASAGIDTLEKELVERLIHVIEMSGFKVDRFYHIHSIIEQDRSLQVTVTQMLRDKREADRQRVQQMNRRERTADVPPSKQELFDELLERFELEPDYPEYVYHFVRGGNTLWEFADRYYGDPFLWPEIYEHNTDQIIHPRRMHIGIHVRIPVELLPEKPDPLLSVEQKRNLVREMFPLEHFRSRSFAYITQQMELRSELQVYSTMKEIQAQIDEYEQLRRRIQEPPDFLSLLIPEAEPEPEEEPEAEPELALENMIMNDTRTPFGHDFYDRFYRQMEFPDRAGGFMIKVSERPIPGRGSQMIIEVNYETVYMFRLPPDHERITELADAAARGLNDYLLNFEKFSEEYF